MAWKNAEFDPEFEVGESHVTADGVELYFHSARGQQDGTFDVWGIERTDGEWREPHKVDVVNSEWIDGWPSVSQDQEELWFTRRRGAAELYRSRRENDE